MLDGSLQEVSRIAAPESCIGSPILSYDRNKVFYCTDQAVLAWDLETGIHRTVKEMACEAQTLFGLFGKDAILQCRVHNGNNIQTLFLSTETGQLLSQQEGLVALTVQGDRYYAMIPTGFLQLQLFGTFSCEPLALFPRDHSGQTFFLPEVHGAVTAAALDSEVRLDYYDLESGLLMGSMSLDPLQVPKSIVSKSSDSLAILAYDPAADCDTIYRWSIPQTPG